MVPSCFQSTCLIACIFSMYLNGLSKFFALPITASQIDSGGVKLIVIPKLCFLANCFISGNFYGKLRPLAVRLEKAMPF